MRKFTHKRLDCLLLCAASMGPQLYRCGNPQSGGCSWRPTASFNGAATLSLRKSSAWSGAPRCPRSRFNGAATLSLRKSELPLGMKIKTTQLQWGRNFIVAEIRRSTQGSRICTNCFNGAATLSLRKCRSCPAVRSSRPRFNGAATLSLRKSVSPFTPTATLSMLQWGRNFIVAEIWIDLQIEYYQALLQWGRNFIVAEI